MPVAEYALDLSGGEKTFFSPRVLAPNQLAVCENVDIWRSYGSVFSRPGRSLFIPALATPTGTRVNAFYEYVDSTGTTRYVVQEGTEIYEATQAGVYTSKKGLITLNDDVCAMAELKDKLYLANPGGKIAEKVDGGNFAALADANAPTNSKVLALWRSKLWAVQDGDRLRCSVTDDGTDWTTASNATFFDIEPGDGSDVIALVPYKDGMLIAKSHRLYEMTGTSFADFAYNVIRNEGLVHARAWAIWESLPIVATPSGIWHLGGRVTRETNMALGFLKEYRESIATSAKVVLGVNKDVLYVAWDSDADGRVDKAKVIDIPTGRISTWTNQVPSLYYELQDGTLLAGTDNSRVAMMKIGDTQADEGASIAMKIRTKAFTFREMPLLRGTINAIRVMARRTTAARTLSLKLILNDLTSKTIDSAINLQNASGADFHVFDRGGLDSDGAFTFAVELETTGTSEVELCGVSIRGETDDGF